MKIHPLTRKSPELGPRLTTSEKAPQSRLTSSDRGREPQGHCSPRSHTGSHTGTRPGRFGSKHVKTIICRLLNARTSHNRGSLALSPGRTAAVPVRGLMRGSWGVRTHLPPILTTWLWTRRRKSSKRLPPASFREQLCEGRRAFTSVDAALGQPAGQPAGAWWGPRTQRKAPGVWEPHVVAGSLRDYRAQSTGTARADPLLATMAWGHPAHTRKRVTRWASSRRVYGARPLCPPRGRGLAFV